jgi:hypothetical protein
MKERAHITTFKIFMSVFHTKRESQGQKIINTPRRKEQALLKI